MKKVQKQLALLAIAAMTCGLLAGCKAEPDPNSGMYEAVSGEMMGFEMDVTDLYENGCSFDLKDGGKCKANLNGDTGSMKWTTDGDSIHIEGGGVELDGTIGDGVMVLEDMLGMGVTMKFECEELYHPELSGEGASSDDADDESEGKSSKKKDSKKGDGKNTGGVLQRLKDAYNGEDVYAAATEGYNDMDDYDAYDDSEEDEDEEAEGGSAGGVNSDYKSVSGESFTAGDVTVMVPDGWGAYEDSLGKLFLVKGGSSSADSFSCPSLAFEYHPNATGSMDTGSSDDVVPYDLPLGDLEYHGTWRSSAGWYYGMFMANYEDGYILASLTVPDGMDCTPDDADVQAAMASVEIK